MKIKFPPVGLKGRFRCVVSRDEEMQDIKEDTGFFNNLIVNTGLEGLASSNSTAIGHSFFINELGRFVVGSGSATPQVTDTTLAAPVAFAGANPILVSQSSSFSRGDSRIIVSHQFGQGQAAGNLSEIGIQLGSLSGRLWSRALILDGNGDPTTITVLGTDFLTVFYELRVLIPQTDATFNIDVEYDGVPTPTVVTARALGTEDVTGAYGWALGAMRGNPANNQALAATDGTALVAPEGLVLGGTSSTNNATLQPYVSGSYERWIKYSADLGQMNSNQLSWFRTVRGPGAFQYLFDPPLQKNNTQTMELSFGYSWARA